MKNKLNVLKREKNVYYFNHRHGVLQNKASRKKQLATGLFGAIFVLGGAGALTMQVLDYQQAKRSSSLQRQSSVAAAAQKPGEQDKLKSASAKAKEDEALAKTIKSKLKNTPGGQKWSVYVRDLNSDRMANINSDNGLEAAGLQNLFLTLPLEAKTSADKWAYRNGKTTLAKCIEEWISNADPECARTVGYYNDVKNAEGVVASHGFKKAVIEDKKQEVTARETGDLLYRLQNGQLLSDKARRVVFDGLYSQKNREGIAQSCVASATEKCLVASITGESKNVRHDAAIVTSGTAKYVVVIMTQGGSWSQIADLSKEIRTQMNP
jgi:hypothetical protein